MRQASRRLGLNRSESFSKIIKGEPSSLESKRQVAAYNEITTMSKSVPLLRRDDRMMSLTKSRLVRHGTTTHTVHKMEKKKSSAVLS